MGKPHTEPQPSLQAFTDGELKALLFAFDSIAWLPGNAALYDDLRSAKKKVEVEFKERGLTP
jgi:hypothetical protein